MTDETPSRAKGVARVAAINVLVLAGLLLVAEGAASLYQAVVEYRAWKGEEVSLAERLYTEYDPLVGWINKPNVSIDDLYGPGVFVKTNAQRFRDAEAVRPTVPAGRIRVVCSGDSFTFGYGVDNDHAWCNRLRALDPRVEPVNMGQGGYGVDQSFLWYQRDGMAIAHDVHVFAFLTIDFERMAADSFLGYPKPVLTMKDGRAVADNVPVPRRTHVATLHFLRDLALFKTGAAWFAPEIAGNAEHGPQTVQEIAQLAKAVFRQLNEMADKRGAKLLFVHLPEWQDYDDRSRDGFRKFLKTEAVKLDVPYLDLVEVMRGLPSDTAQRMFIDHDIKGFVGSKGHYNTVGNAFVSEHVMDALRELGYVRPAK